MPKRKSNLPPCSDQIRERELTARLQKGGALLDDMRQLVCHWRTVDDGKSPQNAVAKFRHKATRARVADTYRRAFYPRFVNGSPANAWQIARAVEDLWPSIEIARPLYYWTTARGEPWLDRSHQHVWDLIG